MMMLGNSAKWGMWIYRALTFLVISCPCALVVSIPLSFFAGIGGASHEGVLVKGSNCLETLSKTKTVVFDKTGTLTKGVFEVTAVHPEIVDENTLLHLAAHVERYSAHPIAVSLKNAYPDEKDECIIKDIEETAGHGVKANVNGDIICVGNEKLMKLSGAKPVSCRHCEKLGHSGTVVHISRNGEYIGHIVISDVIKPNSEKALNELKRTGVRKIVMLTGDSEKAACAAAKQLPVDEYYSELLPADKVDRLEDIINDKNSGITAFVGDGINDAPVLSRADVGIAMGAMGSDAAIESADIVLMDDDPLRISKAIKISRKCLRIVKENIWFSIGIKVLCLVLGALGFANMWAAVFADVGVMVIAVLNAIRALFVKNI